MTEVLRLKKKRDVPIRKGELPPGVSLSQNIGQTSLAECVRRALSEHHGTGLCEILLQENKEKYYNTTAPHKADGDLQEVFQLMRLLNRQALMDPELGQSKINRLSFSDALTMILDRFCNRHASSPIQYVELGPEPEKTSFILHYLLEKGLQIDSYIGVDINPASAPEMKSRLGSILSHDRIGHSITSFDKFRTESIRKPGTQTLITMLGFQEGNEDPAVMSSWLNDMTNRGDLLISEMQLSVKNENGLIADFYRHPLMKRFSRIAFTRVFGEQPSKYSLNIRPVTLNDGNKIQTAVMGESFQQGSGGEKLFVTNYCLKYSKEQFRHYRENYDSYTILDESYVGDQSIVFQLSQRR